MKRFLKFFVAVLQFLLGAAFAAALILSLLNVYDFVAELGKSTLLGGILYGAAGLYVALSAIVIVMAVSAKRVSFITVPSDGYVAKYSLKKIKNIGASAADVTDGFKLKKLAVAATPDGYAVKTLADIENRTAETAIAEFSATFTEMVAAVIGIKFASVQVKVKKVISNISAADAQTAARVKQENEAQTNADESMGENVGDASDAPNQGISGSELALMGNEDNQAFDPVIEGVSYGNVYEQEKAAPPPLAEPTDTAAQVNETEQPAQSAPKKTTAKSAAAKTTAAKTSAGAKTTAKPAGTGGAAVAKPATKTAAKPAAAKKAAPKKPAAVSPLPTGDDRPPFD